uniref:Uncharacterized protein n=1 Tax=Plectus sambesii TaxID=2011161 RepID=A0A914USN2_9BILA
MKKSNGGEVVVEDKGSMSVLKADCEEILKAAAGQADAPVSESNLSITNEKNGWKHKMMIGLLAVLFAGEFFLAVTAHCLTERFAMCHTLILVLFAGGKMFTTQPRTSVVFLVISLVAGQALSFVNCIHAVRMLIHRHDSGIHHINYLFAFGVVDLLIKIINLLVIPSRRYGFGKQSAVLFHLCVPGAVLSVVVLQIASKSEHGTPFVLILDPALTIVCCLIFSFQLIRPMMRSIPILLLAVPKGFSVAEFKRDFHKKFPNSDCHELHVYRESDGSFDVSLHIRQVAHFDENDIASVASATANIEKTAGEIRSLFARAGAQRITIQTEIVSDASADNVIYSCYHGHKQVQRTSFIPGN